MSRAWTCGRCGKRAATDARRGPLPKLCDPCKLIVNMPAEPEVVQWVPPILRDPFNSTPTTAPVAHAFSTSPDELAGPVAEQVSVGPGPMELQLKAELDAMQMVNPTARTQSLLALQLARAADQADPGDIKTMLAVGKELRALLEALNKIPAASGGDDDDSSPFGAVRPEIQHPPAV
jgi:hypothetical protein